jgi:UDP-N-acetylglucosamine 2-epimerase (non-hydrolysing)
MTKKRILFVFGTRPEAIKMSPIIHACQKRDDLIDFKICLTGQHKEMLHQALSFFEIIPDFDLATMTPDQNLFDITINILSGLQAVIKDFNPDIILVQGDTTTAMTASLAGFFTKIKIGHIEAGLRSFNKYAPYPEEINRKMVGVIADYHFAPTEQAKKNLENEDIMASVFVTGNTVIDALLWGVHKVRSSQEIESKFNFLENESKLILVTAHRRESFGTPFENICEALLKISKQFNNVQIVYPVHLNPNVQQIVYKKLGSQPNIHLIAPLDYPSFIWLMDKSYIVITDSGGIQEEAPSLGKPVLVLRDVTERQEGIAAGTAHLVGTNVKSIFDFAEKLLTDNIYYQQMAKGINPYGDGKASEKILNYLLNELNA